jgi:hypothetical protein
MVVEQVRDLGVDLILGKMVNKILTDENHCVTGVEFKDGDTVEGTCVCFAVSSHLDVLRTASLTLIADWGFATR